MAGHRVVLSADLEAKRQADLAAAQAEAKAVHNQVSEVLLTGATLLSPEVIRLNALQVAAHRRAKIAANPGRWLSARNRPEDLG